jgi:hypothetical protein
VRQQLGDWFCHIRRRRVNERTKISKLDAAPPLKHFASPEFWFHYRQLPEDIRDLADKQGTELEFTEAWELPGLFASAQRVERDDCSSGVKPAPAYRYVDSRGAKNRTAFLRGCLKSLIQGRSGLA